MTAGGLAPVQGTPASPRCRPTELVPGGILVQAADLVQACAAA